jgi:hypothetical protein
VWRKVVEAAVVVDEVERPVRERVAQDVERMDVHAARQGRADLGEDGRGEVDTDDVRAALGEPASVASVATADVEHACDAHASRLSRLAARSLHAVLNEPTSFGVRGRDLQAAPRCVEDPVAPQTGPGRATAHEEAR